MSSSDEGMMTFGEHLEVLRQMLFRVLAVAGVLAAVIFWFKEETFSLLFAPSEYDFCTYKWIERVLNSVGIDFEFSEYHVDLIATELSSQFMTHITTSIYLGMLLASPYVLFELFRYISPALYDNEKRYASWALVVIYFLFGVGVLMSYFILFPISFRFLGTYSVAERVVSNITLDSYISTFSTLTLVMGLIFQLPVIAFVLAKLGFIESKILEEYRQYALLVIMIVAAIITPPDIMTLILVTVPLYMLYEISIRVCKWSGK